MTQVAIERNNGRDENGYPFEFNIDFKGKIRKRDGDCCVVCGRKGERYWGLSVHHINYCKEDIRPDNLISLCQPCHVKTNANREYWQDLLCFMVGRKVNGPANSTELWLIS
jgi:hypothetical protein